MATMGASRLEPYLREAEREAACLSHPDFASYLRIEGREHELRSAHSGAQRRAPSQVD
jgi:hypothetical protein